MKSIATAILLSAIFVACNTHDSPEEYTTLDYKVYFGDNEAGYFKSSRAENGSYQYVFEFNDRGRGPHLEETIRLNDEGLVESLQIIGHNYLKDTVSETFEIAQGTATWQSTSENGQASVRESATYVGVNSAFGNTELTVRKMLQTTDQSIDLYPSGTLKITATENVVINDSLTLNLIEFVGFSFSPSYIWFDSNNRFFSSTSSWLTCIRAGYSSLSRQLLDIQTNKEKAYYAKTAKRLTKTPEDKIAITNVNLFDTKKGKIIKDQTVVLNGNQIEKVQSSEVTLPNDIETIDGKNKTLLPGLFDMHTHMGRSDGILNLAAGVTSTRDLANSLDLPEIRDEFDNNTVLGPRILIMSGFIDQAGPYAGPIGKIISTLDEGLEAIDFYQERGYQQIKLYSSIDPSWVKPLAAKAQEQGLRVSGHIPSYMIAEDAIKNGYDEIQHINMIALNFMTDTIDTRTPLRFSMIGEHAHALDLNGKEFSNFVKLMKEHKIVLDPTVSIFEGMLTSKAGEPDPQFIEILDRLPIQVSRGFYSGGLPIPNGREEQFKRSYSKLLEMIKALHDAGITIVPGTDAMAGFSLHKELENYVKAGISEVDVLKMATITSAQVTGYEDQLGSIEVGKLADLILIDGNPIEDISAIRRVELTIKDGNIYVPKKLYEAVGVKYFK